MKAIDQAQLLAGRLALAEATHAAAKHLSARLDAIRGEAEALRFAGSDGMIDGLTLSALHEDLAGVGFAPE